jgi:hypothetical protein
MEYEIDRDKVEKEGKYAYEDIMQLLDLLAEKNNLRKERQGKIVGPGTDKDYAHMGKTYLCLRKADWFLPYISKWIMCIGDEYDDIYADYLATGVA